MLQQENCPEPVRASDSIRKVRTKTKLTCLESRRAAICFPAHSETMKSLLPRTMMMLDNDHMEIMKHTPTAHPQTIELPHSSSDCCDGCARSAEQKYLFSSLEALSLRKMSFPCTFARIKVYFLQPTSSKASKMWKLKWISNSQVGPVGCLYKGFLCITSHNPCCLPRLLILGEPAVWC